MLSSNFLKSNDKLSKYSNNDLNDLLINLNNYYIRMRDRLGIDSLITFGTELEIRNCNIDKLYKYLISDNPHLFNKAYDNHITRIKQFFVPYKWNVGKEILPAEAELASPIYTDSNNTWDKLMYVCGLLTDFGCIPVSNHIHIGKQIMKNDIVKYKNLLLLWTAYENIIFRLSYGEHFTYRETLRKHAKPIGKLIVSNIEKASKKECLHDFLIAFNFIYDKAYSLNLMNIINDESAYNTIEIRCSNGTLKSELIQNTINFFIRLILYANRDDFDYDVVNKRIKKLKKESFDLNSFCLLDIHKALELFDLIYDNNLDKIDAFAQYYKRNIESIEYKDIVRLTL